MSVYDQDVVVTVSDACINAWIVDPSIYGVMGHFIINMQKGDTGQAGGIDEASLGYALYWVNGLLDVSIDYVHDISIGNYATNASVNLAFLSNSSLGNISQLTYALNSSIGEYAVNSSVNLAFITNVSLGTLSSKSEFTDASLYALTNRHNFTESSLYVLTSRHNFTESSLYSVTFQQNKTDASLYALNSRHNFTESSLYTLTSRHNTTEVSLGIVVTNLNITDTSLALKANKTYVDGSLSNRDTSILALDARVLTLESVTGAVTKEYVDGSIANFATNASVNTTLTSYATNSSVNNAFLTNVSLGYTNPNFATNASVNNAFLTNVSLGYTNPNFATNASVNNAFLTNASLGYTNPNFTTNASVNLAFLTNPSLGTLSFNLKQTDASLYALTLRHNFSESSLYTLTQEYNFTEASLYELTTRHNFTESSLYSLVVQQNYTDASLYALTNFVSTINTSLNYIDGSLNYHINYLIDLSTNKLNNTTDTFTGLLTIDGSILLIGDLYQDGSTYVISAQNLDVSNNFINIRAGAITAIADGSISGLKIVKANGTDDVIFGTGNDAVLRIGWNGDILEAVATREDTPTNGWYAYWDDGSTMFKTFDLKDYIDSSIKVFATNASVGIAIANFATNSSVNTTLTKYLKESSLGTDFEFSGGLIDIVTIDISEYFYSKDEIDATLNNYTTFEYVDGSLAKGISIDQLYITDTSVYNIGLLVDALNTSTLEYALNSQLNITDTSLFNTRAEYISNASLNESYFKWGSGLLEPSVEGGSGSSTLIALTDVSIVSIIDNQVLAYDDGDSVWKNKAAVNASVWDVVNASEYFWIFSDVSLTSPVNNQALCYNSTAGVFVNKTLADPSIFDVTDGSLYFQSKIQFKTTCPSSGGAGNQGDWCIDASFLYVCTSTNTWGRLMFTTGY